MTYRYFKQLAVISVCISAIALMSLIITIPNLLQTIEQQRTVLRQKSLNFQKRSNILWNELEILKTTIKLDSNRRERSTLNDGKCKGCFQLACSMGQSGLPGEPGIDGNPGDGGMQGPPGDDGHDVELTPEADLPCIICPAGPPGLRGHQGERGRAGESGYPGDVGAYGFPGPQGVEGHPGQPGLQGSKGVDGPIGPPGDDKVAGTGTKGPRGPVGSPGPKGPMGSVGKPSKTPGAPGAAGITGYPGLQGSIGRPGEPGGWGPPGQPGQPASYCESDCGVSRILAPAFQKKPAPSQFTEQSTDDQYLWHFQR